jgi:hypothetical protein
VRDLPRDLFGRLAQNKKNSMSIQMWLVSTVKLGPYFGGIRWPSQISRLGLL